MLRSAALALLALSLVACGSKDRAAKTPDALLRDVATALRNVRSLHFDGSVTTARGQFHIDGDVAANGRVHYRLRTGDQRMELIEDPPRVYMRANAAFWRKNGGAALAPRVAGHWIQAPAQDVGRSVAGLEQIKPKGIARCLSRPTGDLAYKGTASVGGKQAIVIVDRGNRPGDAPGVIYVQARGPALLLRAEQTGPVTPGAALDPSCGGVGPSPTRGDIRLTRFDEDVTIATPSRTLDLSGLRGATTA